MSKISGLGWTTFSVASSVPTPTDIKNDVNSANWAMPRALQDVTGLDKSAIERLELLADWSCTAKGTFNAALSHPVFKDCSSTAVIRAVSIVIAAQTLSGNAWVTDYQLTRDAAGAFTWSVPLVLADGTAFAWS